MEKQYIILNSQTTMDLSREVNKRITDGYTPIGGLSVTFIQQEQKWFFAQALIKMPVS